MSRTVPERLEGAGTSAGRRKCASSGPGTLNTDPEDAARERHSRDSPSVLDDATDRRAVPNPNAKALVGETAAAAGGLAQLVLLAEQL